MNHSLWTHAICNDCWDKENPGKVPRRLVNKVVEDCCFCGQPTISGIYVKQHPADTPCRGMKGAHVEA